MALASKNVLTVLSTTNIDLNLAAPTTNNLYVVPADLVCVVTHLIFREPSSTLAAATDLDLGSSGTAADQLWNGITLTTMTATSDYTVLHLPETKEDEMTVLDEGDTIQLVVTTGAAAEALTDVILMGILSDT